MSDLMQLQAGLVVAFVAVMAVPSLAQWLMRWRQRRSDDQFVRDIQNRKKSA